MAHSLSGLTTPIVERLREWSKTLLSHEKHDGSNPFNDLRNSAGRERFDDRLRLIFDSIPALIHTTWPDGYIDYFNRNWLTYVGRSLEDIQGWKWTSSIHPDDVEGILERWRASLATGEPFLYETRVRRADGEFRWMLHHKVPLRDERGSIIKWFGSSIDIEDRKCAEERLRRSAHELQMSESYLAEGQRLAHLGSWAFDHAGFNYWSPELFRIHGLDPAIKAPSVQEYLDCVHPQDRESMANLIKGILAEPSSFDATKRIVRPDGEVRYIRCVGAPVVENQSLKKYVGSAIDVTEHELLTQEVRRREAYLTEAQSLSHTGSFGWKPESGEIVWSDETYRIFEYGHGVKPTIDLVVQRVHPEERSDFLRVIDRASGGATHFEHTYRLLLPDGRVKHVHALAHVVQNASGNREFVGAVTDITERKRAEEKLRQSEAYLAEAQKVSHTGSWAWSPVSNTILYWSEECYRILGYDPAQGLPSFESSFERIHPEDRSVLAETIERAVREEADFQIEYRLVLPDGTRRNVRILSHPVLDASGKLIEFVGTVMDVTEQERAEEAVRRSEKELRNVIETIPAIVWSALPDGSNTYVNSQFVEYSGMSGEQTAGLGWQAAIHPDDLQRHVDKWRASVATGEPYENELRFRRADGQYRWHLDRGLPLRDETGNILKWYGVVTDIEDRKRAEEAVRASEHRFRLAVESIPGLVTIMNAKGEIEVVNGQALNYFGKTLEEVKRWGTTDVVHPDDLPRVLAEWKDAIETEQPYVIENRLRRADGMYRWFLARGLPLRDDEGRIVRWYGLLTDIDDRKNAEEKLRRSETYLHDAQRLSRTGSWTHDVSSGKVTISPEQVRIWGIQTEDNAAVSNFFFGRMHPDDRPRVEQVYKEAQAKKTEIESEFRIVLPDRTIRHIHSIGHPIVNESGDIVEFVGTSIDITQHKQAEQRLIVQHTVTQILATAATLEEVTPKILQTVCELLSWDVGALWSVDREAGVLRCVRIWHKESVQVPEFEEASRNTTFMPGIGLPGRVWFSREPLYIPDVVRDSNFPRAPIVGRGILHAGFGFPILLRGDVLGVMEFFSHEIKQPDQELLDMMATLGSQIGQFIERKRAEEAVRTAQMELAHVTRVATLGEMTASIAHEINQPLGAIVNNAGASLRWLAAQNMDEVRQSIEHVIKDGHRASEIISRIRALVKKTRPQKDRLDLSNIVREVITLARAELDEYHVDMQVDVSNEVPVVWGDRIQIQQVLLNLIMNAIEAMSGAEGSRMLRVGAALHDKRHVLVAVQDSGPGLNPSQLNRLFEAFYSTKPGGLGMGLAISRSIIEAHDGRLWASTNEDRGATFHFTLPIGEERPA